MQLLCDVDLLLDTLDVFDLRWNCTNVSCLFHAGFHIFLFG